MELVERFDQLNWDDNTDLDDGLEYFVTKVNEVPEDLIPAKKKKAKVKTHRSQPWFSEILQTSKKLMQNCERV